MDGSDGKKAGSIAVGVKDRNGAETLFKVKPTTKLEKIFGAYAQRTGVPLTALRFTVNGTRVSEGQTLKMVGLGEGGIIDCSPESASQRDHEHSDSQVNDDDDKDNKMISIRVRHQDGDELTMKVRRKTRLEQVFHKFAEYKKLPLAPLRFLFDGKRLTKDDTAKMLELEDDDLIDCMVEHFGGHCSASCTRPQ